MAPPPSIQGAWFDGASMAQRLVTVELDEHFVRVTDTDTGERLAEWFLASVRCDPFAEGRRAQLHPKDSPHPVVEIEDPRAIDWLRHHSNPWSARIPKGRRLVAALVGGVLAIVGLAVGAFFASKPLSRALARQIPIEWERGLAPGADQIFRRWYCSDQDAAAPLDALVERLAEGAPTAHPVEVRILDWDQINAFALPGGDIALTRALLEEAESADEVAGVLAHELQHVYERHIMAAVVRASVLSFLWGISVGDYSQLLVLDPATSLELIELQFSRETETRADEGALELLSAAGISARGFADFFERIEAKYGEASDKIPTILQTHPASRERRARALAVPEPRPEDRRPALSPDAFERLKRACRPTEHARHTPPPARGP